MKKRSATADENGKLSLLLEAMCIFRQLFHPLSPGLFDVEAHLPPFFLV